MERNVVIRVKTIDNKITDFELNLQRKVIDLKKAIEEKLHIPVDKQRLIYQGRLMDNEDTFSNIKFETGFVVHLIAQQQSQQPEESHQQQNSDSSETEVPSFNNSDFEFLRGILRAIRQTTEQRQNLRRFLMQQRGNGFNQTFEDSQEMMYQNLSSIKQLLNCCLNPDELTENQLQNETFINPFKFQNRKLKLGQWVDVQDTIHQWLEAQVIDIKDDKVFIHYNGWGNRWDEWIQSESPRIAQFRTYTVPSLNQEYLSPTPQNEPEGEPIQRLTQNEFPDFISEMGFIMNQVTNLLMKLGRFMSQQRVIEIQDQIQNYIKNHEEIKGIQGYEESKEQMNNQDKKKLKMKASLISSQISPIFDRLGRMMIDISPQFAVAGSETQRISNQSNSRFAFQVPVMLTPHELSQTQIHSPEFQVLFTQNQRQEQQSSILQQQNSGNNQVQNNNSNQ